MRLRPPGFFGEPIVLHEPIIGPARPPSRLMTKPRLEWSRPAPQPPAPPIRRRRTRRALVNIIAGGVDDDHRITRANHEAYARRCGAEYVVLQEPKPEHSATTWKYRACDVASEFEQTLYLDADCVVSRDAPDVFEQVPIGCWGVVDELPYLNNVAASECRRVFGVAQQAIGIEEEPARFSINGGVLMLPPNAAEVYRPDLIDTWLADQSCLSARLQAGQADYRLLDWRWNCCWMFDKRVWETERVFIRHRAGQAIFQGFQAKLVGLAADVAKES